jgi:hypothetical protein
MGRIRNRRRSGEAVSRSRFFAQPFLSESFSRPSIRRAYYGFGKSEFRSKYGCQADDAPEHEFELIAGATLGFGIFGGFSIFVEPSINAAFIPSAASLFTITPGASFSSERVILAAGWMIPINENAKKNKMGGLTMAAESFFRPTE